MKNHGGLKNPRGIFPKHEQKKVKGGSEITYNFFLQNIKSMGNMNVSVLKMLEWKEQNSDNFLSVGSEFVFTFIFHILCFKCSKEKSDAKCSRYYRLHLYLFLFLF